MANESALYGELARYYDLIYHWKNYQNEVARVKRLIRRYKTSPGNSLLDVGCGTGMHLRYLKQDFKCVGIDSSPEMIAVARQKVAGVRFEVGDMAEFNLGRLFDVITCLFSGIGYLKSRGKIGRAIENFSRHLNVGGVLILEPWIKKSEWMNRSVHLQTYDSKELKIARVHYGRAKGNFSILDERFLIGEKNKGISYIKTKHVMRFFEPQKDLEAMRRSGFNAIYSKESLMSKRRLLIGVRHL
jgi:ubiquinone/menaquinone biosynthesis C-methylase UbiE